jgi:hypothetical protein
MSDQATQTPQAELNLDDFVCYRTTHSPVHGVTLCGELVRAKNHVLKLKKGTNQANEMAMLVAKRPDISSNFVLMPSLAQAEAVARAHMAKNQRKNAMSGTASSETAPQKHIVPPSPAQVDHSEPTPNQVPPVSEPMRQDFPTQQLGTKKPDEHVVQTDTPNEHGITEKAATAPNFAARFGQRGGVLSQK